VQKRRIYDITNVLEGKYPKINNLYILGIGYIAKVHKNKIKWTGEDNNTTELIKEINELY